MSIRSFVDFPGNNAQDFLGIKLVSPEYVNLIREEIGFPEKLKVYALQYESILLKWNDESIHL